MRSGGRSKWICLRLKERDRYDPRIALIFVPIPDAKEYVLLPTYFTYRGFSVVFETVDPRFREFACIPSPLGLTKYNEFLRHKETNLQNSRRYIVQLSFHLLLSQ